MKKPLFRRAVTIFDVVGTDSPARGETELVPWISWRAYARMDVSHECAGDELFRGVTVPMKKSDALSSISTQPSKARRTEVALVWAGVGFPSAHVAVLP